MQGTDQARRYGKLACAHASQKECAFADVLDKLLAIPPEQFRQAARGVCAAGDESWCWLVP